MSGVNSFGLNTTLVCQKIDSFHEYEMLQKHLIYELILFIFEKKIASFYIVIWGYNAK